MSTCIMVEDVSNFICKHNPFIPTILAQRWRRPVAAARYRAPSPRHGDWSTPSYAVPGGTSPTSNKRGPSWVPADSPSAHRPSCGVRPGPRGLVIVHNAISSERTMVTPPPLAKIYLTHTPIYVRTHSPHRT
jgi:hypothetical protein